MDRKFLMDCGRYKKGDVRGFPEATWRVMATQAKVPVDKLAAPVNEQDKARLFAQPRRVTH